jgi:hypothetical protein
VRVQVVATPLHLACDLNDDGFVGLDDLNVVLGRWNRTSPAGVWLLGDVSDDGFIGIEDLNAVLGNWNAGTPPLPVNLSAVPELATRDLLATVLGVWGVCRRRTPLPDGWGHRM